MIAVVQLRIRIEAIVVDTINRLVSGSASRRACRESERPGRRRIGIADRQHRVERDPFIRPSHARRVGGVGSLERRAFVRIRGVKVRVGTACVEATDADRPGRRRCARCPRSEDAARSFPTGARRPAIDRSPFDGIGSHEIVAGALSPRAVADQRVVELPHDVAVGDRDV